MQADIGYPALLFRQYLLLAWFAGVFASRFFWPGLTAWGLLLLLTLANPPRWSEPEIRRSPESAWPQLALALLLLSFLSFGLGLGYAAWREPARQPLDAWPDWAREAVAPDPDNELYQRGLRLRGRVAEVNGQTDRRLQVILEDLAPVADFGNHELDDKRPFMGRLVLTWYDAPTPEAPQPPDPRPGVVWAGRSGPAPLPARPAPGQTLEISLRLREVRGLQNPGLWEPETYWRDRGVWLRAWTSGSDGGPRLSPDAGSGPAAWRERLRQRINEALPRQTAAATSPSLADGPPITPGADFIPALLLGDRYLQGSVTADLMARSTLAHSLALSGLHLGYVAALAYSLVHLVFHFFPGLGLFMPKRRLAVSVALPPTLFYVWLGGASPSLWRSWLMLLFWGLLLFLKRPAVLLDGLLWAVFCILLFMPQVIFDLRLQLSALSIAAIALVMPWLNARGKRLHARIIGLKTVPNPDGRPRRRSERALVPVSRVRLFCARLARASFIMLGISLSVQIILMPILVRVFGLYGLAFPLNLLWLPVLGGVVMPAALFGCAAAALHCPTLAEGAFYLASLPCAWLMELLSGLDAFSLMPTLLPTRPHWLFTLGYWLCLTLLPWLGPRLLARFRQTPAAGGGRGKAPAAPPPVLTPCLLLGLGLLLCLAPTALRYYETGRDLVRLRLLDVGQGQSVLLEWPGGGRLLLDGGGGSSPRFDLGREVVAASLTDNRPPRLEFMLASHPDLDHAGGLVFPLRHLDVGYFGDNGETSPALLEVLQAKNQPRHGLRAGDSLQLAPDLSLEILWPFPEDGFTGNNASLVTRLIWRGESLALLCGDAEIRTQRRLLQRYPPERLAAQVLVLPHHGAAGASLPAFYDAVRPQLALASAGYGNRWHMPAARTRAALCERGIPLLSTDRLGQIRVEWPGRKDGAGAAQVTSARSPAPDGGAFAP